MVRNSEPYKYLRMVAVSDAPPGACNNNMETLLTSSPTS